jgi:hypothetical protein
MNDYVQWKVALICHELGVQHSLQKSWLFETKLLAFSKCEHSIKPEKPSFRIGFGNSRTEFRRMRLNWVFLKVFDEK